MVKVSCKMGGSRLDPVTGGSGSDKSPLPNRVWDVLQLHLDVDPCMYLREMRVKLSHVHAHSTPLG
eukprot:m.156979 g.156979  ORF g.156979 m.156979 type:complete len:66 (+) comp23644_c0_seq1:283-480(+)